jgi:glycosyltransferase involved in cell wall biosynthesis
MIKKGWLVNDTLTCIPGTKTFWHDLLEWIPDLEDKCNGLTPFNVLPDSVEHMYYNINRPDYIIRNASYFRKLNLNVKTISLLQDILPNNKTQIDVCNSSDIVVFNSPYTRSYYEDFIHTKKVTIPLGVDFEKFKPTKETFNDELDILPNSILFIGSTAINPKGFDILLKIIDETDFNFCLVMKDEYVSSNQRVKVFNRVNHDTLVKIINSCKLLVCTSRVETLHLSGVEAAACNIPLVTTNVGIYYDLHSGSWGRNVFDFNHKKFIDEINYVMENYDKFKPREEFLKMGLDLVTCKNNWVNLIESL